MPNIKVQQDTYEKLKSRAAYNYRSMSGEIDYLMDKAEGLEVVGGLPTGQRVYKDATSQEVHPAQMPLPLENIFNDEPQGNKRTHRMVLTEIREAERQLEEAMSFNQDPDSRAKMEREGKADIQEMWNEYHFLKGDE